MRPGIEIPQHIGIIPDGNRRYGKKLNKGPLYGHRVGADTTKDVIKWCNDIGVERLTIYALSTENLNRSKKQVDLMFNLLEEKFNEISKSQIVQDNKINIRIIGDKELLPDNVKFASESAEQNTKNHDGMSVNIAAVYGGRNKLLNATSNILKKVDQGELDPGDIDHSTIESYLYSGEFHQVDFIIRTGGVSRLSNFLPWFGQGYCPVFYSSDLYWPEFDRDEFDRAIRTYSDI